MLRKIIILCVLSFLLIKTDIVFLANSNHGRPAKHLLYIGMKYYKKKKYKAALAHFKIALKIKPGYEDAIYNVACMYALLKKAKPALKYLRDLLYRNDTWYKNLQREKDFRYIKNNKGFIKLLKLVVKPKKHSNVFIKKTLLRYRGWDDQEPETIPWIYCFGRNTCVYYAGYAEWTLKRFNTYKNDVKILKYEIKNNVIYIKGKRAFVFMGYGSYLYQNASGAVNLGVGFHLANYGENKYPIYAAGGRNRSLSDNDKLIAKFKALLRR